MAQGRPRETRKQIETRRQSDADTLVSKWAEFQPQIDQQRASGRYNDLAVQFAACARKLARVEPQYAKDWAEARERNLEAATTALMAYSQKTPAEKTSAHVFTCIVDLMSLQGRHAEAKAIINAARSVYPKDMHFFKMALDNAINLGEKPQDVLRESAAGKSPEERRAYALACYEYAEDGLRFFVKQGPEKMKGVQDFLKYLAPLTKDNEKGFSLLADYSRKMGDVPYAVAALKMCITMTHNQVYYAKLAQLLADQGRKAEARQVAAEGLAQPGRNQGLASVAERLGVDRA